MECNICGNLPIHVHPSSLCSQHSDDYFQCILKEAHGNFYQRNGQPQKALHYYLDALRILPKFTTALLQITLLFQRYDMCAQALQYADKWLKISPSENIAMVCKGIALCWLGRYAEAIESFNSAHIFAQYVNPLNQKNVCHVYALVAVGQFSEALLLCNKTPKDDPFYSDIKELKKQCCQHLGLEPRWKMLVRNISVQTVSEYPSILHDLATGIMPPCQFFLPRRSF